MEIIKQMKTAIDYMEENLLEDISFSEVAKHVYMSAFNFHRTFKIFTGITPNEYIRNRRLSNAGEEVLEYDGTLLDLALKYHYDTLEGFAKAFKRFHGTTPSVAKSGNVSLTIYHPLKINISFEGGKGMNYKIVTMEPFTLLIKTREFELEAEENLIPGFWDELINNGKLAELKKFSVSGDFYGICHQEDPTSENFIYGIGVKAEEGTKVNGWETIRTDNPVWAVFECKTKEQIESTWDFILKQFFVNSDYSRVDEFDFELYPANRDDIFCELYVPVRKK